jgi:hypothetical protein
MNSVNEVCNEIYATMKEILFVGYRRIDEKILKKLEVLRKKALECKMEKGEEHIGYLIKWIKIFQKEKNHITNDEVAKRVMVLIFYSENIAKYNDRSEF